MLDEKGMESLRHDLGNFEEETNKKINCFSRLLKAMKEIPQEIEHVLDNEYLAIQSEPDPGDRFICEMNDLEKRLFILKQKKIDEHNRIADEHNRAVKEHWNDKGDEEQVNEKKEITSVLDIVVDFLNMEMFKSIRERNKDAAAAYVIAIRAGFRVYETRDDERPRIKSFPGGIIIG